MGRYYVAIRLTLWQVKKWGCIREILMMHKVGVRNKIFGALRIILIRKREVLLFSYTTKTNLKKYINYRCIFLTLSTFEDPIAFI